MTNNLKTTINGSQVQLPIEQFKKLISNYETLKSDNIKLMKANNYLNTEIKKYNRGFTYDKE